MAVEESDSASAGLRMTSKQCILIVVSHTVFVVTSSATRSCRSLQSTSKNDANVLSLSTAQGQSPGVETMELQMLNAPERGEVDGEEPYWDWEAL